MKEKGREIRRKDEKTRGRGEGRGRGKGYGGV